MTSVYARNDGCRRKRGEDMPFWASVAVAATLLVLCALSATYARPPLEFHVPLEPTFVGR